jgi:hypothetical protein
VVDDADAIAPVHVRSWQAAYRGFMPDEVLDGLDVGRCTRSMWIPSTGALARGGR